MADYIRRDIVLEIINTVNNTGGFAGYADYCVLFDEIDTMPAADVQPIKHGRWESSQRTIETGTVYCSNCAIEYYISDLQTVGDCNGIVHYCPNCGAKMDIVYQDDKIRAIKVV